MLLKRQALRAHQERQTLPTRSTAVPRQVDLALEALGAFALVIRSPDRLLGQLTALFYFFPGQLLIVRLELEQHEEAGIGDVRAQEPHELRKTLGIPQLPLLHNGGEAGDVEEDDAGGVLNTILHSVRTGPGARVELRVGDEASRLSIPERSEVRVGEVTRAAHTIQLQRGRIDVDYHGREDRVLRVRSENGTVAETRAARFTMLRNGAMVAVATRGGSVSLSSAGGTVEVGAGQQSEMMLACRPRARAGPPRVESVRLRWDGAP